MWIGCRQSSDSGVLASDSFFRARMRGGDFGLTARHEDDMPGLLGQRETDGVVGGGVAGV